MNHPKTIFLGAGEFRPGTGRGITSDELHRRCKFQWRFCEVRRKPPAASILPGVRLNLAELPSGYLLHGIDGP